MKELVKTNRTISLACQWSSVNTRCHQQNWQLGADSVSSGRRVLWAAVEDGTGGLPEIMVGSQQSPHGIIVDILGHL